jgi:hypothetical protein
MDLQTVVSFSLPGLIGMALPGRASRDPPGGGNLTNPRTILRTVRRALARAAPSWRSADNNLGATATLPQSAGPAASTTHARVQDQLLSFLRRRARTASVRQPRPQASPPGRTTIGGADARDRTSRGRLLRQQTNPDPDGARSPADRERRERQLTGTSPTLIAFPAASSPGSGGMYELLPGASSRSVQSCPCSVDPGERPKSREVPDGDRDAGVNHNPVFFSSASSRSRRRVRLSWPVLAAAQSPDTPRRAGVLLACIALTRPASTPPGADLRAHVQPVAPALQHAAPDRSLQLPEDHRRRGQRVEDRDRRADVHVQDPARGSSSTTARR